MPSGPVPQKSVDISSTLAMCLILVRDAGIFLPGMIMPYLRKKRLNRCPLSKLVFSVRSQPVGGEPPLAEQTHEAQSFEETSSDTSSSQSSRRRVCQSISRWSGAWQLYHTLCEVGDFALARFKFRPTSFSVGVLNRSYILVIVPITNKQRRLRKVAPFIHFCSFLLLLFAIHIRWACFCRRMSNAHPAGRHRSYAYALVGTASLNAVLNIVAAVLMSSRFLCEPSTAHADNGMLKNAAHILWGISLFPDILITIFCIFTVWNVVKQMKRGGDAAICWYLLVTLATASHFALVVLFRLYGYRVMKYTLVILACFEMSRSALDHLEEAGLVVDDELSISTQISE